MSIRNLDAIFKPRSIAIVGASARPGSVGLVLTQNILAGGFAGQILAVNPKHSTVAGLNTCADVSQLPVTPDLAVICTPPATVPGIVAELARRGTKGAVVITAGFKELGSAEGYRLEQAILDAAQPFLMRIVGPNCVGVMSTAVGLNATFAHIGPRRGNVAFVTQSGAMATTVLDWASDRGIGFSYLASLGDMADVDFGDMLDYLANDPDTTAIMLYIESITSSRKFMSAARAAARLKPVIVIKAGRHAAAARAASSHTGAMAGADGVYDAAFRRAGMLRVITLSELFDAAETLATSLPLAGDRLAILTNGGGAGVLATDALLDHDGKLANLSAATVASLDAVLPQTWSHGNPIDIIGDAPGSRYAAALRILQRAPEVDATLVLNCPTAISSGVDAARAVAEVTSGSRKAIMTSWLGSSAAVDARRLFAAAHIPTYETPDAAIRGFMHLVRYNRNRTQLLEVPDASSPAPSARVEAARAIVERAAAKGGGWLRADEVADLLECYGIRTARSRFASDSEGAAESASALGYPVALKIVSPEITHKSEVGGVALGLKSAKDVRTAADAMLDRVRQAAPGAHIEGFIVQEMIHRPLAHELILGMAVDRQFGPFLLFGQGGTAVEVIGDKAIALPPLNRTLACDLMARTRIYRQLQGYRNRPAADLDAIADVLVRLSQLVCDLDEIVEVDLNPLLADDGGTIVVDARVLMEQRESARVRGSRLAILPYPRELEQVVEVSGVGQALLRPVKPEDAAAILRLFDNLSPEDVHLRFFGAIRTLSRDLIIRLTQIDYDRQMAFVLEAGGEILGVARLSADPDNCRAEFAVTVRSDLKSHGMGTLLMRRLVEYARRRGIEELVGEILAENARMISLARDLGFRLEVKASAVGTLQATLPLREGRPATSDGQKA